MLQKTEKIKKVRYKLKKGITWDIVKQKLNQTQFEYLFEEEKKPVNKYKNKKVEYEGIRFDSEMEKEFYIDLLKLHNKEEIELQPKFVLQEKFRDSTGKTQREIKYVADFRVGNIVYDIKGMITHTFKIKEKCFKLKYPLMQLKIIKKAPKWTGKKWIELSDLKVMEKERREKKQIRYR